MKKLSKVKLFRTMQKKYILVDMWNFDPQPVWCSGLARLFPIYDWRWSGVRLPVQVRSFLDPVSFEVDQSFWVNLVSSSPATVAFTSNPWTIWLISLGEGGQLARPPLCALFHLRMTNNKGPFIAPLW
jgi:hypothetical protein